LDKHRSGRVDAAEIQKALERIGVSGVSLKVRQFFFVLLALGDFAAFVLCCENLVSTHTREGVRGARQAR
jgi:hypothetical protein